MNANILVLKKSRTPFFSARKTSRESFVLSFHQTYILSLLVIGVLGIYYVWALNMNATKGYNILNLEVQRKESMNTLDLINIKIAETQSLDYIGSQALARAMEPVDNPSYFVMQDGGGQTYAYKQ